MTNYARQGRAFEHKVRALLVANGYDVVRAAASKGPADLIAIKPGQVLIIQCKATALPSPHERAEILRMAACIPGAGLAIVARKGPRGTPVKLERLLTADRSPSARIPFSLDEVAS